jgi:hypothetical protein
MVSESASRGRDSTPPPPSGKERATPNAVKSDERKRSAPKQPVENACDCPDAECVDCPRGEVAHDAKCACMCGY